MIHGNRETGECEEGLRDIVKGVCWRVLRNECLRKKYLEKMGLKSEIDGDESYGRWLAGLDEGGEMVNAVRLCLNVWKELK